MERADEFIAWVRQRSQAAAEQGRQLVAALEEISGGVQEAAARLRAAPAAEDGKAAGDCFLVEVARRFRQTVSREELPSLILELALQVAPRAALLAVRDGRLLGWGAMRTGPDSQKEWISIRSWSGSLEDEPEVQACVEQVGGGLWETGPDQAGPVLRSLTEQLGGPALRQAVVPMILWQRPVAVLYGDEPAGTAASLEPALLEGLAHQAALLVESLLAREARQGVAVERAAETAAVVVPAQAMPEMEEEEVSEEDYPPADVEEIEAEAEGEVTFEDIIPESVEEPPRGPDPVQRARMLVRVIVKDIALYNPALVEKGRQEGRLGTLLQDEIKRGLDHYRQSVAPELAEDTSYFYDLLVQELAHGDPSLMGPDYQLPAPE
jgi:hypothetical protein